MKICQITRVLDQYKMLLAYKSDALMFNRATIPFLNNDSILPLLSVLLDYPRCGCTSRCVSVENWLFRSRLRFKNGRSNGDT
jgi:hypothetical protein